MTLSKEHLGRTLAQLRKGAGLSQRAVAARAGVSDRAVSKWETGAAFPGMDTLAHLADLYGMPLADLITQAEDTGRRPRRIAFVGGARSVVATLVPLCARALMLKGFDVAVAAPRDDEPVPGQDPCHTDRARAACALALAREDAAAAGLDPERGIVLCAGGLADAAVGLDPFEAERLLSAAGYDPARAAGRYDVALLVASDDGADDERARAWRAAGQVVSVDAQAHDAGAAAGTALLAALAAGTPFTAARTLLVRRASRLALDALPGVRTATVETTFARTPHAGLRQLDAIEHGTRTVYLADGLPIGRDRFSWMLSWADPAFARLRAERWTLCDASACLAVDRFPFMPYTDLVRAHLPEGAPVRLPHGIELVRDVTESPRFSLPTLARDRALGRL